MIERNVDTYPIYLEECKVIFLNFFIVLVIV